MINIREESVYNLSLERSADEPVRMLVMRHWPRGVKREKIDLWLPDAAPSAVLLKSYSSGKLTWDEFEKLYRAEQSRLTGGTVRFYNEDLYHTVFQNNLQKLDILVPPVQWIHNYATSTARKILLLCWEREGHCHRHVLLELVKGKDDLQP